MKTKHRLTVLPVLLYLAFALAMAAVVPPLETPDAPSHIMYVQQLYDSARLPSLEQAREGPGYPATLYEWHQVPFYYIFQSQVLHILGRGMSFPSFKEGQSPDFSFVAPSARMHVPRWPWWATEPGYDSILLLRLVNIVFFGLPCVVFAGWLGEKLTGDHDFAAMWSALLALMPQFVFVQISVQNDTAAILWATLAIGMLWIPPLSKGKSDDRRILLVGVFLGLALITKLTTLPLPAFVGLWALYYGYQRSNGLIRVLLLLAAPVAMIVGIYGMFGDEHFLSSIQYLSGQRLTAHSSLTSAETLTLLVSSFWGRFGWMNVPLPSFVTWGLAVLSGVGVLNAVLRYWKRLWPLDNVSIRGAVLWMGIGVLLQLVYVSISFFPIGQPQGRFMFPFLVPLLGVSLLGVYPRREKMRRLALWCIIFGGVGLDILTLWILYLTYWVH